MNDRVAIQREAVRRSLQLRRSLSIPREFSVNVFDIAISLGVEVQFMDLPSLEGMFYRGPNPKVILPSFKHRPRGRVAFTCAHELGHFDLGHGTRVDEYVENEDGCRRQHSIEELAADAFAASLLMPRPAVLSRFLAHGWKVATASPVELYRAATELDVGYATLCNHMRFGLELVDDAWLKSLLKFSPKQLREMIAPNCDCTRLLIIDEHWPSVPIDLEVGECLQISAALNAQLPQLVVEDVGNNDWSIYRAAAVGESKAKIAGREFVIRISRAGFCGLLKYRYLEEGDVE